MHIISHSLSNKMACEAEESEEIVTSVQFVWDEKYARGINYAGANFGRSFYPHSIGQKRRFPFI